MVGKWAHVEEYRPYYTQSIWVSFIGTGLFYLCIYVVSAPPDFKVATSGAELLTGTYFLWASSRCLQQFHQRAKETSRRNCVVLLVGMLST